MKYTAKFDNKRVIVEPIINFENEKGISIQFKRLMTDNDIIEIEKHPTAKIEINRNVVTTNLLISTEAAYALYNLLDKIIKKSD